ncbi:MAG: HAD family hydrolase [Clostridia bacterium]|nr:HAD family hydrolase [Clostridia bacterium]
MPTLYLTDLDGTLLRSDQRTSAFTNDAINRLVGEGMLFSYATARSYHTAKKVAEGIDAQIPLIVYNGAFIIDNRTQELLLTNFFCKDEAQRVLDDLLGAGIQPIVYCFEDGRERFMYQLDRVNRETREFLETRMGDFRDTPVFSDTDFMRGDTFYFTCIGEEDKLAPMYEKYRDEFHCVYQKDIYSGAQWLEIMPRAASKAHAARQLAALLGCERIVAFGDAVNDIPLFEAADECYAVANASEALKARATGVIASNDEDGVARWLSAHARIGGNR